MAVISRIEKATSQKIGITVAHPSSSPDFSSPDFSSPDKDNFISPRASYRGEFTPEHLAFNANLQEFAQQVSLLCNLETAGKIPPEQAYQQIRDLWQELKTSKNHLLDADDRPTP
jgi:hypothetical protein